MEALTDEMERQAEAYFKRIDEIGGVIPAIEAGFFQRGIADAAVRYPKELEDKRRSVVGVNDFPGDEEEQVENLRIDPRLERRQAEAYCKRIDEIGGVIPAIEAGFFQREIADAAFRYQKELEDKRRIVVGVNDFTVDEEEPIEILRIDPRLESQQSERVREVRRKRDGARATNALNQLRKAAAGNDNLMPYILDAVRAYA